ncbi:MAG: aldehyde dehydrogenase family protein [Ottowia sp.]
MPWPRSARPWTSCATTAPRWRRSSTTPRSARWAWCWPSAPGTSRWPSSAGQVAAALAAGNTVLAKPAEQTPLTAAAMVQILHEAGVPQGALQLVPGRGETVGAALVAHPQVAGVMFTGSTEVARIIARQLASRLSVNGHPIPLIAETGGQNAMIVDSSALAEQVVADVLASAFDSAGQRCSALRVLCLQEDVAERTLTMLRGRAAGMVHGQPRPPEHRRGPGDRRARRARRSRHISSACRPPARRSHACSVAAPSPLNGHYRGSGDY